MPNFVLRKLESEDEPLLFHWRNDPFIVSLSARKNNVERAEHSIWFHRILNAADVLSRIIVSGEYGAHLGFVKVEKQEKNGVIDIYHMRAHTGVGIGPQVIHQIVEKSFESWSDMESVVAKIRRDNTRSARAFSKAGFKVLDGEKELSRVNSEDLITMVMAR